MELKGWKDAWVIFKRDLCVDRFYLLWNVMFMLYFGVMFSTMLYSVSRDEGVFHPLADCLMLVLMPIVGFYFSRRSFSYLRENSYTQMLWYYRILPIPSRTIMKSRHLQLITSTIFNGFIFFGTIFLIHWIWKLEMNMGIVQFIAFAVTWLGYTLCINGLYIYMELLKKGKVYFWLSMVLMLGTVIVSVAISIFNGSLVRYTIDLSVRYSLLSPLMWGSLLLGFVMLYLMGILTVRKLNDRDLI